MNIARDLAQICEKCYQDWITLVSDGLELFVNWTKDKYKIMLSCMTETASRLGSHALIKGVPRG